jgi:death-on-curing protein
VTALTFLEINGVEKTPDDARLYDAMIAIAERRLDRAGLAEIFRLAAV